MIKKLLFLFPFFFHLSMSAQSDVYKKKIDSLEKKLPVIKSDTSRIHIFLEISSFYKNLEKASDAMVYSKKAVELSRKIKWNKGLILSYKSLASSYEYKSDFVNELVYYKKALALAKEVNDNYLIAGVYRNLAVAESNVNPDSSFKYYDDAILLFRKLGRTDDYLEALLQKGGSYSLKGMNYEAADCFREVRDVSEKNGNLNFFMTSSKLMADIYSGKGDKKKALEIYLDLLKKAEKKNVYNNYTSDVYSAVAHFYSDENKHKLAIAYYKKALHIDEKYGDIYGQCVAFGYISNEYHSLNDPLNEKKYLANAHTLNLKNPYKLSQMYGYVFFGRMAYAKDNFEEALKNHLASLAIGEELGVREQAALADCNVGATYFMLSRKAGKESGLLLDKAIFHLEKGIKANKIVGNLDRISSFLDYLYKAYDLKKDYKNAFSAHKDYLLYRDSLYNKEKGNAFLVREKEYEYEKKETLLKAGQKITLEKEKSLRNMSLGGAAVLVVIAAAAGVAYVRKRKDNRIIAHEKKRSDDLLLNILPYEVAEELKDKGEANAKYYEKVTILFTDFEGFTKLSEKMAPAEIIGELNYCFKVFDTIVEKYNIEKIKTIGDAYMAVSGLPVASPEHAINVVKAALEIRDFILNYKEQRKRDGKVYFEMRIGINSGEVVAGIVGVKKFAYDIWGDAVNVAARMETNGVVGKVNISEATYDLVKDDIAAEYRGEIEVKGKGKIKMYFAEPK